MSLFDIATRVVRILPAESAHRATIDGLKTGLAKPTAQLDDPRLAVTLRKSGLKLPNPIGLAAGFDKNAEVFAEMLAFGFGFVECGTVTPRPQAGNPRPRLFRLDADRAVINRMGFNNEGIGMFVRRLSSAPRAIGIVGANVGANKDFPQPFGPTTPVRPGSIMKSVGSTNDLKPWRRRRVSFMNTDLAWPGANLPAVTIPWKAMSVCGRTASGGSYRRGQWRGRGRRATGRRGFSQGIYRVLSSLLLDLCDRANQPMRISFSTAN